MGKKMSGKIVEVGEPVKHRFERKLDGVLNKKIWACSKCGLPCYEECLVDVPSCSEKMGDY